MDSIQLKIAKIQAGAYNINDICDVKHSLCNIQVSSGRAIVAMKYKMSPLEVTDVIKVDREVPKSIYVIALPVDSDIDSLGHEVILDMSYGAITTGKLVTALKMIGFDEQAALYKQMVIEQFMELKLSNVQAQGY